jgi:hypothetical protein
MQALPVNQILMKYSIMIRISCFLLCFIIMQTAWAQRGTIQFFRPYDQHGVNIFETSKNDTVLYDGFKLRIGANFTQGYQNLKHSNSSGVALYNLSGGFPLAQATLNIDVQLADGVRIGLVSYMASHHHNETWVKGGYLQIDKISFLKSDLLDKIWKDITLKVGHMEINYGDAHFRRSDGGNTFWNPFMENNIIDAFTTEIGAELYWQKKGIIAMFGMTNGEIQGSVAGGGKRAPSIYGKLGFDKMLSPDIRVRLTGSVLTKSSSINGTLFHGDRTGSNYQYVMEPASATLTVNAFSGRLDPGFNDNVTTFAINPFVKLSGFELFGTVELAQGNTAVENGEVQYNATTPLLAMQPDRKFNQYVVDVLYRFGGRQQLYIGAKYNKVNSELAFWNTTNPVAVRSVNKVSVDRTAFGAGWYITQNILVKGEYVRQNYNDYPINNILTGGKFDGFALQGSIAF